MWKAKLILNKEVSNSRMILLWLLLSRELLRCHSAVTPLDDDQYDALMEFYQGVRCDNVLVSFVASHIECI